jgi:site-specific recombinase XerD
VGAKTKDTALYSLRHNFKDALVALGLGEREQDILMGHASEKVGSIYGSRETTQRLIDAVRAIRYEGLMLPSLGRFPDWIEPRK